MENKIMRQFYNSIFGNLDTTKLTFKLTLKYLHKRKKYTVLKMDLNYAMWKN